MTARIARKEMVEMVRDGRFLAAGATHVFVGPSLDLHGPNVMVWPAHDDHLHVRFPDPDGTGN